MKKYITTSMVIAVAVVFWLLPDSNKEAVVQGAKPAQAPVGRSTSQATADNQIPENSATGSHNSPSRSAPTTDASGSRNTVHKPKTVKIKDKEYPLRTYKPLAMPNDPSAPQWWVTNTKLDQAWDTPAGGTPMTLAVIDTGFALQHEEFTGRWYQNTGEKGVATNEGPSSLNCTARGLPISASCNLIDDDHDGVVDNETGVTTNENPSRLNCTARSMPLDKACNRLDDDGNGLADDVSGWDFTSHDNLPQAGEVNPAGTGTTHGTRVAGIAAATGNNAKGIAGVDWSTAILPIQAIDDDSYGDTLSVGRAINYAVDQGVDVISLSLGSDLPDPYVREAVARALKAGIVVVAASGNDGCDCIVYPANYPEVLAVGALNTASERASFSSYGANVDLLAPGVSMTSSDWRSDNGISGYVAGINGTSFATPLVGGLLTRLKSQQPTATPAQLIAAVTENINRLSLGAAVPHDTYYGFGTVDALKATTRMASARTAQILYAFTPLSRGDKLTGSALEPIGSAIVYKCENNDTSSTQVYELTKGTDRLFTISKVENQQALSLSYVSSRFFYACITQPHDNVSVMRGINVFREFRNIYDKP